MKRMTKGKIHIEKDVWDEIVEEAENAQFSSLLIVDEPDAPPAQLLFS